MQPSPGPASGHAESLPLRCRRALADRSPCWTSASGSDLLDPIHRETGTPSEGTGRGRYPASRHSGPAAELGFPSPAPTRRQGSAGSAVEIGSRLPPSRSRSPSPDRVHFRPARRRSRDASRLRRRRIAHGARPGHELGVPHQDAPGRTPRSARRLDPSSGNHVRRPRLPRGIDHGLAPAWVSASPLTPASIARIGPFAIESRATARSALRPPGGGMTLPCGRATQRAEDMLWPDLHDVADGGGGNRARGVAGSRP
jgi:hypothetical protein